jgi:hypothetical protein
MFKKLENSMTINKINGTDNFREAFQHLFDSFKVLQNYDRV